MFSGCELINLLFVPEQIVLAEGKISSRYILCNFIAVCQSAASVLLTESTFITAVPIYNHISLLLIYTVYNMCIHIHIYYVNKNFYFGCD